MPAPSWVPLSVTRSPPCIAASHTLWLDGYKEAEVTGNLLSRQGARGSVAFGNEANQGAQARAFTASIRPVRSTSTPG